MGEGGKVEEVEGPSDGAAGEEELRRQGLLARAWSLAEELPERVDVLVTDMFDHRWASLLLP